MAAAAAMEVAAAAVTAEEAEAALRHLAIPRPMGTVPADDPFFHEMSIFGARPTPSLFSPPVLLVTRRTAKFGTDRYYLLTDMTSDVAADWVAYRIDSGSVRRFTVGMLNILHQGNFLAAVLALVERPSGRLVWCTWGHCNPRNLLGWVRFQNRDAPAGFDVAAAAAAVRRYSDGLQGNLPPADALLPLRAPSDVVTVAELAEGLRRRDLDLAEIEAARLAKEEEKARRSAHGVTRIATLFLGTAPPGLDQVTVTEADRDTRSDDHTLERAMADGGLSTESARLFMRHFQTHVVLKKRYEMFRILDVQLKDTTASGDEAVCCVVENCPNGAVWLNVRMIEAAVGTLEAVQPTKKWKKERVAAHQAGLANALNNRQMIRDYDAGRNRPASPHEWTAEEAAAQNVPVLDENPELTHLLVTKDQVWSDCVSKAAGLLYRENGNAAVDEDLVLKRAAALWNGNADCRRLDADIAALSNP